MIANVQVIKRGGRRQLTSIQKDPDSQLGSDKKQRGLRLAEVAAWYAVILRFDQGLPGRNELNPVIHFPGEITFAIRALASISKSFARERLTEQLYFLSALVFPSSFSRIRRQPLSQRLCRLFFPGSGACPDLRELGFPASQPKSNEFSPGKNLPFCGLRCLRPFSAWLRIAD